MTTVRTPPLFLTDVVIVGGCGRVGLPLGVALASRGLGVVLCDINAAAVQTVNDGRLPFAEPGAAQLLADAVREGRLRATTDPSCVAGAETLIVVVGTPIDEHLNPEAANRQTRESLALLDRNGYTLSVGRPWNYWAFPLSGSFSFGPI